MPNKDKQQVTLETLFAEIKRNSEKNEALCKKSDKMFDGMAKFHKDFMESLAQTNARQTALEKSNSVLENEMKVLKNVVSRLEQEKLNSNLIVRGIPEHDSEDLRNIVMAVFLKVDSKLSTNILSIRRIGVKRTGYNRAILVKLSSSNTQVKLLAVKRKMVLTCSEVSVSGEPIGGRQDIIYFGEHLGSINSKIYYVARQLVKKKELLHAWTRSGSVYVRKSEGQPPQRIDGEHQFKDVLDGEDNDDLTSPNQSLIVLEECLNTARSQTRSRTKAAARSQR